MGKRRNVEKAAAAKPKGPRPSNASSKPDRVLPEGMKPGFYRSKSTIQRLRMYNNKPDMVKRRVEPQLPVRIAPDRRWFANSRTIGQSKLQELRDAVASSSNDPYSVILKRSKLPLGLVTPQKPRKGGGAAGGGLLGVMPFGDAFGKKAKRKRPRLESRTYEELMTKTEESQASYEEERDEKRARDGGEPRDMREEDIFKKGTSRRIWQELYKVVDSSDILIVVIDARDPEGTRCRQLERHIKQDRPFKHVVLLMNKADLIPTKAAQRWVKILSKQYPTVAYHASITNPFGKGSLMALLRQYASLMKDRKHVSVGFVGFPNVGKSSVINSLRGKKVCSTAPIPGQTKVWQYVALTSRVHLIDCPGIVPSSPNDSNIDKMLRGCFRAERVQDPEEFIPAVLERVQKKYLLRHFGFDKDVEWESPEEFLHMVAVRLGKLKLGGEPDTPVAARVILTDWLRGRLPFYVEPPYAYQQPTEEEGETQDFSDLKCLSRFDESEGEEPAED